MIRKIITISLILLFAAAALATASDGSGSAVSTDASVITNGSALPQMTKYIAAAFAIGAATIASGIAIGRIGSAAMGAVSERPEAGGTAIILAALAEGVCLWGFLIAFFILR